MDTVSMTIGLSWICIGLLTTGLAIPLVQGRVKRNALYGVRFRQSFESDEAWLAINRFGGWAMIYWAVPLFAVGVVALFLPLGSQPFWALVFGFAPLLCILVPLVLSWRFARRYGSDSRSGKIFSPRA